MVLYTQPGCGQCKIVHMLLDKKGIKYEECQDSEAMAAKGINHTPTLETDDGQLLKARELFNYINEVK